MSRKDKQSPSPLEGLRTIDADYEEEDDAFFEEPPCMCAQQIISTLFGTILGYLALLLSPKHIYFPLAIAQGTGIALGILGTERTSIKSMSSKEPYIIAALSVIVTYFAITAIGTMYDGEITLGTLLWTSFLLANIATWTRACTKSEVVAGSPTARNTTLNSFPSSPAPNGMMGMALGMSTPDRKLKFKASGDERDWFAANSNSVKV